MKKFFSTVLLLMIALSTSAFAQIKINEIVASNASSHADQNGDNDDWVELYNAGSVSVNLAGMYVSDDSSQLDKWQIPSGQSATTTISPGEFLILWFDKETEQGALHVDMKLSADGEAVILTEPDGETLIDSVSFGAQTTDIAWGRVPDGSGTFKFLNPTPEASNNGSQISEQAEKPAFSLESGFYSGSEVIGISSATENAEIRYEIGGSAPTPNSPLYENPITVDSSSVIRAMAFAPGFAASEIATNSYFFEDPHTIPLVSFVMEPDSLFDYDKGMYVIGDSSEASDDYPWFGANFWEEWEYPVHIEYMKPGGSVEFEFDAGASIGGNFSRAFPKKSFIINNNADYGIDELEYELFPENDYDTYDGFGLRAGAEERSRLLNELMYTINKQWGHKNAMQAYEPVAMYINGKYWGIYNLQERKNDDFVESRYGYDDIDMIKDYDEVKDGTYDAYQELLDVFQDESLTEPEFFIMADSLIDLESFTDHWIYQVYSSHGDPNNLRYWRPQTVDGKWYFISHDFDWWRNLDNEPGTYIPVFTQYLKKDPAGFWLIGRMMQNPTYREIFLNRLADMLNTAFKPDYMISLIDSIDTAINPEMPRDIERWDEGWYDNSGPTDYSMEYFYYGLKEEDYGLAVPYVLDYPDFIYAEIQDTLQTDTVRVHLAQTSEGSIQLNSITPDLSSQDWSGIYFEGTTITLEVTPEPGLELEHWLVDGEQAGQNNVLTVELGTTPVEIEAAFQPVVNDEIVINEINYNPSDDFDAGDWIELYNYSETTIDLSGWVYKDEDDEHEFVIPNGTSIASGGYLVITNDTAAFKQLHPNAEFVKGEADFGLSGSGDQVRIFNPNNSLIDFVEYNDEEPWPLEADGNGATLALIDYELDNSLAESWMASKETGGTPSASNDGVINSSEEDGNAPKAFALHQNYPNPFNPTTRISFSLAKASSVEIIVYNMLGQEVKKLMKEPMKSGEHTLTFDARNLPSGVYIYRLTAGKFSETKKMILLK
ncbi:MAG: lamin tail domain-containing protein [Gracilimonas sp.]|uniref:lamin tail domain-containing protein n=1 Tax=Gracilimonas TaxID=649462 RepID=UPI001B13A223|nr:lamin tail domain-containing protein [Gracilimonas sp.]MBO6584515.1 lamin tail domain-containing protein [Gracilimonas sp.]MBO6616214.1 lamin tail domain-containing protein [Gracilimonas sp.]